KTEIGNVVAAQFPSMAHSTLWKGIEENKSNMLNQPWIRGPLLYTGLLVALWAASGGTAMTMSALDKAYDLEVSRSFLRHRFVAIVLTIAVSIMLLAVMCLLPIATIFKQWVIHQGLNPGNGALLLFDIARCVLSILLMTLILTVMYHNGPFIRQR